MTPWQWILVVALLLLSAGNLTISILRLRANTRAQVAFFFTASSSALTIVFWIFAMFIPEHYFGLGFGGTWGNIVQLIMRVTMPDYVDADDKKALNTMTILSIIILIVGTISSLIKS